ncbi:MAG: 4-hydroxy-tetrahydrodipicolinate reductase [Candidatus Lustribacter sp.]
MRVGVAGALGRLGRVACAAVDAADGLDLVAAFDRDFAGELLADRIGCGGNARIHSTLDTFYGVGMDVVVDCTIYPVTVDVAHAAIGHGVSPVIAATGRTEADIRALAGDCERHGVPGMLVPNFSVGAVLMMKLAVEAAKVMPHVEIIELHHEAKQDAPSGTAKLTAQRIADAGGPQNVPIHSVRLPGLVAHQEVLFGGLGETLTIRHDSLSRDSFGPGIVLAVRNVRKHSGLTIGLESLLFPEVIS